MWSVLNTVFLAVATASSLLAAPTITTDDLGPLVRGRMLAGARLAPATEGAAWSVYCCYRDHAGERTPFEIFEINCSTRAVRSWKGTTADVWQFYSAPDGNLYALLEDRKKNAIARLDTATGKLDIFRTESDYEWPYFLAWGHDGMAYICTYRGARALQFNPATGEFRDFGKQGNGIARTIAADKRYVYTVVARQGGDTDLVAFELATGRKETLKTYSGWFVLLEPDAVGPNRLTLTRQDTKGNAVSEYYTVQDAEIKRLPPGTASPTPQEVVIHPRGGGARPAFLPESAVCKPDGAATVWFRNPGQDWQSADVKVAERPSTLFRIGTFGDGKVVVSSNDPYTLVQWDPVADRTEVLGLTPNNTHVYAFAGLGGKGYFCGYSGAPLLEWTPGRRWTSVPPSPTAPAADGTSPDANPRVCHRGEMRRAYDLAVGADGRLYVACGAYLEREPGGAIKVYSPATGKSELVRQGYEVHAPVTLCAALDGQRLLSFSTPRAGNYQDYLTGKTAPPAEGFLLDQRIDTHAGGEPRHVAWDPECYVTIYTIPPVVAVAGVAQPPSAVHGMPIAQRARFIPVAGLRASEYPGELVEWRAGQVVGRCASPRVVDGKPAYPGAKETTFFLVDTEEAKSAVKLKLPGAPTPQGLLRLPDGRMLSNQGGELYVIDPATWQARSLGRLDCAATDWVMLGNDLYLLAGTNLRRVRDFAGTAATAK